MSNRLDPAQMDRALYPHYKIIFTYRIAGACVSAETGDAGNAHIFTQNFFAVAIK